MANNIPNPVPVPSLPESEEYWIISGSLINEVGTDGPSITYTVNPFFQQKVFTGEDEKPQVYLTPVTPTTYKPPLDAVLYVTIIGGGEAIGTLGPFTRAMVTFHARPKNQPDPFPPVG